MSKYPQWFVDEREHNLNLLCDSLSGLLTDHEYQEFIRYEIPKWRKILNSSYEPKPRKKSTVGTITDDMIARAKEYPIEQLFDGKTKSIKCPFHDDRRPSASIKNNRFKCWACGERGDSIEIYKKLYNCSFQEAVKQLQ